MSLAGNKWLNKKVFPLLTLTLFAIIALVVVAFSYETVEGETSGISITTKDYLGFLTIIINFIIYFFARKLYKYSIAITLILGLFNLVNFTLIRLGNSLSFGSLTITFQPIILLVCIITYAINYKLINNILFKHIAPPKEKREKIAEQSKTSKTNEFKIKFEEFENEKLEKIIIDERYVPEAKEGAKQILAERVANAQHQL